MTFVYSQLPGSFSYI